eukprot:6199974-Pleurochrysis_carterae.AAC.1
MTGFRHCICVCQQSGAIRANEVDANKLRSRRQRARHVCTLGRPDGNRARAHFGASNRGCARAMRACATRARAQAARARLCVCRARKRCPRLCGASDWRLQHGLQMLHGPEHGDVAAVRTAGAAERVERGGAVEPQLLRLGVEQLHQTLRRRQLQARRRRARASAVWARARGSPLTRTATRTQQHMRGRQQA